MTHFHQIIELLGQPPSTLALEILSEQFQETPIVGFDSSLSREYVLTNSGFSLRMNKKTGNFESVSFFFRTANVLEGFIKPYSGDLPSGILATDSSTEVEKKMPGGTMAVKDYRFDTDLRPLVYTFTFDSTDGQMTALLVEYEPSPF
jgi:hypothetical protein